MAQRVTSAYTNTSCACVRIIYDLWYTYYMYIGTVKTTRGLYVNDTNRDCRVVFGHIALCFSISSLKKIPRTV